MVLGYKASPEPAVCLFVCSQKLFGNLCFVQVNLVSGEPLITMFFSQASLTYIEFRSRHLSLSLFLSLHYVSSFKRTHLATVFCLKVILGASNVLHLYANWPLNLWSMIGLIVCVLKSSRFGYLLSSKAIEMARLRFYVEFRVAAFWRTERSIWQMHKICVSIRVAACNCTWKKTKVTYVFW